MSVNNKTCLYCSYKDMVHIPEHHCYMFVEKPTTACMKFLSKPSTTSMTEEPLFPSQDSSLQSQVGGDHYKSLGEYQPWQVLSKWLIAEELQGYMKGTVIVYLCRNKENVREDIEKAKHTIELYLELSAKENKIVSSK